MTVILTSLFLLYSMLLLILITGWRRAIHYRIGKQSDGSKPLMSVVIAARNEEMRIGLLLEDLSRQHDAHFQVIVVDDHSEDATREIVHRHAERDHRFQLQVSHGEGKKAALSLGIKVAAGSIIVTTDADCRVGRGWLTGLREPFADRDIQLVFGAVRMEGNTFFEKVQAIEFLSLIGTGAASAAVGFPTMCNGANLAFRKSAFESVNGYEGNFHIASGDDEFLMKKILNRFPGSIVFAANPGTIVTTLPNADLALLVQQRIRWAGKWKLHQSNSSKMLAVFIFCFQCAVMLLLAGMLMQVVRLTDGLFLLSVKTVLEFIFLWRITRFLHVPWNWSAFILLQLIYPFYSTSIGLASNVISYTWKGRKLHSLMTNG